MEDKEGLNVRRFWKSNVLERYAKTADNLERGLSTGGRDGISGNSGSA